MVLSFVRPKEFDSAGRLDPALKSPLYHQIYVVLRNKIQSGEYPPGAMLPGEHDIANDFRVSRITAKRALNELAGEGLVVRSRGRGTRVAQKPPPPQIQASVESWLENASVMGRSTRAQLLDFAYVPAGAEVSKALALEAGAVVQRSVRVRWQGEETFSYLITYVPEDIGRSFTDTELSSLPLLTLLERDGVTISDARQIITATIADADVAAALRIHIGAPLLEVRRVVRDQTGRPVEYLRVLYRPDQYHYEIVLSRVQGDGANSWLTVGDPDMGEGEIAEVSSGKTK